MVIRIGRQPPDFQNLLPVLGDVAFHRLRGLAVGTIHQAIAAGDAMWHLDLRVHHRPEPEVDDILLVDAAPRSERQPLVAVGDRDRPRRTARATLLGGKPSRGGCCFFNFSKVLNNYVHTHGVKVKDVMTPNPVAITEDTPLDTVVQLMQTRNIKRLPVVRGGTVIGIVSRVNLMRALVSIHREAYGVAQDDAKIRERILDDIAGRIWAADVVVDVVLHNGVADLWGTVSKTEQAQALRVLVESTPGVKRVEHYLTYHGEL